MIPIALFTYNRSGNLQRTLDCLKNNRIDILYIFSDGPRNEDDKQKIKEVRKILDQIDWVKFEKFYQEKNIGLNESIIFGVNKVFEKYDRIICIEDDICVSDGFYEYMNFCLEKYKDNPKIAGITGLKYPINEECFENYKYDIFFYPRFSSWGWGTWKKVWQKNIFDLNVLLGKTENLETKIKDSGADMILMYNSFRNGDLSGGWDVYCSLNMIINGQYFIYPTRNMVENTGMTDGYHAHSGRLAYELKWSSNHHHKIRFPDGVVMDMKIKKGMDDFFTKKPIADKLKNLLKFLVGGFSKIKQKILNRKPDPKDYSTIVGVGSVVPCQIEAYFLALNKYVDESATVLDVGFGLGYGLNILAIKAKEVYGVDVDKKVYDYCQGTVVGRNPRLVDLSLLDGYTLNFPDNYFAIVTCVDTIEHVKDYDRLIKEMMRISKKGIFLSTPNRRPESTNRDGTPKNYWHLREWSFEELDNIVRKYGKVDWNFLNGPFEGPFTSSQTLRQNSLTLSPFIYK